MLPSLPFHHDSHPQCLLSGWAYLDQKSRTGGDAENKQQSSCQDYNHNAIGEREKERMREREREEEVEMRSESRKIVCMCMQ